MSTDVVHKRWWQIFEVVFGIPFLVAIALHRAVPLSLTSRPTSACTQRRYAVL